MDYHFHPRTEEEIISEINFQDRVNFPIEYSVGD